MRRIRHEEAASEAIQEPREASLRSPWLRGDLVAVTASLFFSAMGANAFVQYLVPYLVLARRWPEGAARSLLILAFALTPLVRFAYPQIRGRLGDRGALVAGQLSFLVYLGLLIQGGLWALLPAAASLAVGAGLVFTAGPLYLLDHSPQSLHGKISGFFFTTNFAAWLAAVLLQGIVVTQRGYEATAPAAIVPSVAGLVLLGFVTGQPTMKRTGLSTTETFSGWKDERIRFVTLLMLISTLAFGLMFGSLAGFLAQTMPPSRVSLVIALFYLARLPGSLVAGAAADRFGLKPLLVTVFAFAAVSLSAAAVSNRVAWLVWAIVMLGFQQAAVPVAAMTLAGKSTAIVARPLAYAWLFAGAELGVATALVLSLVTEELGTSFRGVLAVFAIIYLIAAIAMIRLRDV